MCEITLFLAEHVTFPTLERDYEFVALCPDDEYPMNLGRIKSNKGLNVDQEEFGRTIEERQVEHSSALHAVRAGLSIDVVPHTLAGPDSASAAYDDPGLAAVADYLVVMAYDENTQAGDPGPVAGIEWQAAELDGTMAGVPAAKIVLGIPLYARSWSGDQVSSGAYASMVARALGEPDVSYDYDFSAATPELLSDPGGVPTQLWFDDADSLLRKIDAAGTLGLGGGAAGVAGDEDPAFWSVV